MSRILDRIHGELYKPRERTRAQKWARGIIFTICLIGIPLLGFEVALRLEGFHRPTISMDVQTRANESASAALNSRFETDAFIPDRYLLWRMKPGSNVAGVEVSKQGLLTERTLSRPAADEVRILCLGDSITANAYRAYPEIAQRLMEQGAPGKRTRFINAGVGGYSSEQGLRWFDRLLKLKPAIAIANFGWNDQFPALNLPDKELGARNVFLSLMQRLFRHTRVYQYLAAPAGERKTMEQPTSGTLRVSPDQYDKNLSDFVAMARRAGAIPVLATQPEHLVASNADYLSKSQFATGTQSPRDLHLRYNAIVREVASRTGAPLLDLEEEFDRRNKNYLFEADGIHLNGPGHNLAARLLIGVLRNQNVISDQEFQKVVDAARYDTTAPDKPHVAWQLEPAQLDIGTTQPFRIGVRAKNTGNSTLLSRNTISRYGNEQNLPYGGVSIVGTWKTAGKKVPSPASTRLRHNLLPGESTSTTLPLVAPAEPGVYDLEVGLSADHLGALKQFGTEVTTATVIVR